MDKAESDRLKALEFMRAQHAAWEIREAARIAVGTIIVCGGRDFADEEAVAKALQTLYLRRGITMVRHRVQTGADTLAAKWARKKGFIVKAYPADWKTLGDAAGTIRNQQMVDDGAVGCVAFPGGSGTADVCRRAEAAGIRVWRPFG